MNGLLCWQIIAVVGRAVAGSLLPRFCYLAERVLFISGAAL
jgi:hypothetical protein